MAALRRLRHTRHPGRPYTTLLDATHDVGLMPEPARDVNGYKQYGLADLLRLLRIKRLRELGLSLPQVGDVVDADALPVELLRSLDEDLARSVERLQRARHEIAAMLLAPTLPAELPAQLAVLAGVRLTEADRAFLAVLARVLEPAEVEACAEVVLRCGEEPVMVELDKLSPRAGMAERDDLARRLADVLRGHVDAPARDQAALAGLPAHRRQKAAAELAAAAREIYRPAQVDVLHRLTDLLGGRDPATADDGADGPTT